MKGLLFIVTAPSGAGKSSLINALLKDDSRVRLSISHTTRAPRTGEVDGREYHFVDDRTFVGMLERGEFLESAQVHGYRYGTSHAAVAAAVKDGHDLVLEIDWQGAEQVRRLHPDCLCVFILPPSLNELERRLRARGQDAEEVIRRRLESARDELPHAAEFDYVIINNDFDDAKRDLKAIVRAERLRATRQLQQHPNLYRMEG
ncbi:MAG: guanylate kinase [Betaproteobacteria bacterium]|nr:guanylate kinase [Betaproteobacteria bacterium]